MALHVHISITQRPSVSCFHCSSVWRGDLLTTHHSDTSLRVSSYAGLLSNASHPSVMVEEEGGGQRIFQYLWSANNRLYYAAGSVESSALHVATLGGAPQRVERGRFFRLAVSYNGDKVAAAEWYANPNSIGDDLFKLTVLTTNGVVFTLKEGGEEYNRMIPLALQ